MGPYLLLPFRTRAWLVRLSLVSRSPAPRWDGYPLSVRTSSRHRGFPRLSRSAQTPGYRADSVSESGGERLPASPRRHAPRSHSPRSRPAHRIRIASAVPRAGWGFQCLAETALSNNFLLKPDPLRSILSRGVA